MRLQRISLKHLVLLGLSDRRLPDGVCVWRFYVQLVDEAEEAIARCHLHTKPQLSCKFCRKYKSASSLGRGRGRLLLLARTPWKLLADFFLLIHRRMLACMHACMFAGFTQQMGVLQQRALAAEEDTTKRNMVQMTDATTYNVNQLLRGGPALAHADRGELAPSLILRGV